MARIPQLLLTALLISTAAYAHAHDGPEDQKPTYQYSLKSGQLMPLLDLILIVPLEKVEEEKKDSVVIEEPKLVRQEEEEVLRPKVDDVL